MKILHTSDWHLGHTLYNLDRMDEQNDFLTQLAIIVAEEKPDAMVVSGDVFHTATPSAAVQKMYTDGLLKIRLAHPAMTIVVTAGNHDSSSKLEMSSNLWNVVNVKVVGSFNSINGDFDFDKHIIEIKNSENAMVGYVVAVPHCYPQNFPMLCDETKREQRQPRFFQTLLAEVQKRNVCTLPIVLMAHLSATGCDITGHDETVGGIDYVEVQEFGKGYDYLALGHIHCPQTLKNTNGTARYCGSPLPVSFDENYPHSITIVTLHTGEESTIETRIIRNLKPLLTIPKKPTELKQALEELKKNVSDDEEAYIRLNVLIKEHLTADAKEQASEILKSKKARLCIVKQTREHLIEKEANENKLSLEEMQEISPLEIAQRFYKQRHNCEMSEDLLKCMEMAIQQLKEEEQV